MSVQVIRAGASVRVVLQARSIVSAVIDAMGELVVTYSDGTSEIAGRIAGATPVNASVFASGAWSDTAPWSDTDIWRDAA